MARSRSDFYSTIEYIGPRPQKPKRPAMFGGWVIVVIAIGVGCWFGAPLMPFLKAAQVGASNEQVSLLMPALEASAKPGDHLAAAALLQTAQNVSYDPSYYQISYPNGDVPASKGMAADVLVRAYRQLGVDLQAELHEDMKENFRVYPQLWDAQGPDTNIDHRRVPNLHRFFSRKGQELPVSRNVADYQPGDIVVWALSNAEAHIGIVVPGPGNRSNERWVVHNMDSGVKWENVLLDYQIRARFRYPAAEHSP